MKKLDLFQFMNGVYMWIKTDNGLELSDTSTILQQVQDVFLKAFPNLNVEPSTPQGQIITAITEMFVQAQSDITEFANIFVNGGTGVWLDAYCKTYYGITRKQASNGSVTAIISGTNGTIIPVGFTAKSGDYEFDTISEYIIEAGGSCYAELFAKDNGDFSIDAGTLTTIITPETGVERITNPYESTSGTNTETDNELKLRALNSLTYRATSIFDGLLAQIEQLAGVKKVAGYENNTKNAVEYKGITCEPNSIAIVCKGGDLKQIGKVILENKTVGAYVQGDIEIPVYEEISKQTYTMRIYRPTQKQLKAELKVITNNLTTQDYTAQLQEQIINIINSYKINDDIIPFQVASGISLPNLQLADFKMGLVSATATYNPITLNFTDEAVISADNILVSLYE